jgi:hypothetical protein
LGDGELGPVERVVTEREKLKRGIHLLGEAMEADALTLPSKTMNQDDREALERQMKIRFAHHRLLQQRLDRLSPRLDDRSPQLKSNLSTAWAFCL